MIILYMIIMTALHKIYTPTQIKNGPHRADELADLLALPALLVLVVLPAHGHIIYKVIK